MYSSFLFLFLDPCSEYQPHESNNSEEKNQNRLELVSRQSTQSRLSVKQDINTNKNKDANTYINYYISSSEKENQKTLRSKIIKVLSRQAVNILYGILGSIVASALSGAIYSIVNAASGKNAIMTEESFTYTTKATMYIENNLATMTKNSLAPSQFYGKSQLRT